ncbi:MAG TPA: molybdopterin molybdotransferase MoeA [Thermoplasmata archaeon]|nr:molybdopterin molybdotransferase MoeA [Thermoplasmata archaeon]
MGDPGRRVVPRRGVPIPRLLARLVREVPEFRGTEVVSVATARGRVVLSDIRARRTLPPYDRATMDGFALRASAGDRTDLLVRTAYRVVGRSSPGDDPRRVPPVRANTAVEVLTGAPVPRGANTVVRTEDCRRRPGRIELRRRPLVGRDIARRGEDFRPGEPLLTAGTRLRPWHIAALYANEVPSVRVARRIRVGFLRTGAEIVARGHRLRPGGVRDTSGPLVRTALEELGAEAVDLGTVSDDTRAIRRALVRALRRCDVVLTIGGSSVGRRDVVPRAVEALPKARMLARRVRVRPGSSTGVATVGSRPVFLLSGPPVATFCGFVSIVEPFLVAFGGGAVAPRPTVLARLTRSVPHAFPGRELLRVRLRRVRDRAVATPLDRGGASRLSSLTRADGLALLDEGHGKYRRGATVRVLRL